LLCVRHIAARALSYSEAATDAAWDVYGNRLEALKDDRKGQHSIRINDQWRVCFRWQGEDALDVEIVGYH